MGHPKKGAVSVSFGEEQVVDKEMKKRETAGELSIKAANDTTKYDPIEVGHALTDEVYDQLCICADRHEKIIAEDEFFLVIIVAGDPLIKNVRRHKYCALLFLPQPRPQQTVFLYNRHTQRFRRLWSLPDARTMAIIDELDHVAPRWQNTKTWVRFFYSGDFFNHIRKETGITHLAEHEFLSAHAHEKVEPTSDNGAPGFSNPFDFSKITTN